MRISCYRASSTGLAPDPKVANRQRRIDPFQRRIGGGCHLSRDIPSLVLEAGFVIDFLEAKYVRGPKPWSYFTVGRAHRP